MTKLEFYGTDTDTDTETDILADLRARTVRMSACPAAGDLPVQLAMSRTQSSPSCSTRVLFLATILARMSVRDAHVYTCKRVLYTINYRVHVYKITR